MIDHAQPVGPLRLTPGIRLLMVIAAAGVAMIGWRFIFGLGATTALNDGYPWGIWIAFDVVTGTALACGGYAIALLVYALNKGEYHTLVRPAVVTSALGYSMAGLSVVLDVGRPWAIWKVPLFFWEWNLNSALLEVALCIMAYVAVVWLELTPPMIVRFTARDASPRVQSLARRARPIVRRLLTPVIALAMLLPTMHQSSLGTLMVVAGPRVHPLWQTPLLPLLFLVSCLAMGFAAVVFESVLSHSLLKRPIETDMLSRLARFIAPLQAVFLIIRFADLAARGSLGHAVAADGYALVFWIEIVLFAAPMVMVRGRWASQAGALFRTAMVLILGGAVYRFDTFLVAFRPGDHYAYFPSLGEMSVTAGIVALEILGYIALIHYFPILAGHSAVRRAEPAPAHA